MGDQILTVEDLEFKTADGAYLFKDVNFTVNKGDKIAFVSRNTLALNTLFKILWDSQKVSKGKINWGVSLRPSLGEGPFPGPHAHRLFRSCDSTISVFRLSPYSLTSGIS